MEITDALKMAGNKHVEARVFPAAGHGLAANAIHGAIWPRLADGYHKLLVDWIKSTVKSL